jgi:hypothetical protein
LVYQHGADPLTARWRAGPNKDERRQARAEVERYEGLSGEEGNHFWEDSTGLGDER